MSSEDRKKEEQRKNEEKARKEAERQAREKAELLKRQEEERKKAEDAVRKEAEKHAKEDAERKRIEDEKAKKEADRLAKEEAERRKRQEEVDRKAREKAQKEAEIRAKEESIRKRREDEQKRIDDARRAKEEAERLKKEQVERRKLEAEVLKDTQRKAREAAELKRKQDEQAAVAAEKARKEAERLARERENQRRIEEEAKRRQEEQARREAEKKARELEEQRRREAEIQQKEAERIAREQAEKMRIEAEAKRRQEELAAVAADKARKEREILAKEEENRRRAEEEAKRRQEAQLRQEAERRARDMEEQKRREEEMKKKEAERVTAEQAERMRAEAEAKRRQEELARREAERRTLELREQERRDAEIRRREAEKLAREEAEKRRREEEAMRAQQQRIEREQAERLRKEAEARAKAEEATRRETERLAKEQEARRKIEEEARLRQAEKARRDAEQKTRELEEQKRKEEEAKKREEEKLAREEAERKRREEAMRAEQQRRAREEADRRTKAEEKARREAQKPKEKTPEAPLPAQPPRTSFAVAAPKQQTIVQAKPTLEKAPTREEQQARDDAEIAERFRFLKNVKVRFPFVGTPIPPTWKILERYPVNSPFAYAVFAQSPLQARRYFLDEIPLTKTEAAIYSYLLDALEAELTVPREQVNPRQYFADQARKILLKYSIRVPAASWSKIIYFAERDLVGFGILDGMMRDPNIEDVSLDAVGKPIFIYHKGYESVETNITISDEEQMDNLVTRLSHMAGKHVSTAFPVVQGTLPGRHRLIATFRREVSPQGSSATIRKFREDPLTIIDMLNLNLMDFKMAAYTWYLMQNRATATVVGATGAGKTTLLNSLLTLTRLNTKLVTIEEVQEINVPHLNWTSLVSRESYAATEERAGEVGLFDLVKAAMRMRPDILCVGEVRGEEAYVLFQAISTGHGGLSTVHADDAPSAIQRLISEPMNVPKAFIPFLDLVFVVRRISVPLPGGGFRAVRRIVSIDEVQSDQDMTKTFRWDSRTDTFKASYDKSPKLERISRENGIPMSQILKEIDTRAVILRWIQQKGIRNFKELSPILELYVSRPEEVIKTASTELEAKGISVAEMMGENGTGGQRP